MRFALPMLLVLHGAVHTLGFARGLGLSFGSTVRTPIGKGEGLLWLGVAAAFVAAGLVRLASLPAWWMAALPAIALSQLVIVRAWEDARFGTAPNVLLLGVVVLSLLDLRPGSFPSMYRAQTERYLAGLPASTPVLTEADLSALPPLVQQYLRRAGVVGRPRVLGFRARFHGRIRQGVDDAWMDFEVHQQNFVDPAARLFLLRASRFGLPVDGYHDFTDGHARFRVRLASLVDVVDSHGPAMDRTETVTAFSDLCLFAPGALPHAPVRWTAVDDRSVRGELTLGKHVVAAVLRFDEAGDLVDFVSDDRLYDEGRGTAAPVRWSTPVRSHRLVRGLRLPARVDAIWHLPGGDFTYGEFFLDDLESLPTRGS